MKYLIASDLHGDAKCTEQLLRRFDEEKADALLLLGDYLYHGPRNGLPADYDTQKTAELLNGCADKIIAIAGNCDAEVDQLLLDFPITSPYMTFLSEPDEAGERVKIVAHHGHWNPETFRLGRGDVYLHGHTHVSGAFRAAGGYFEVNPGSVSIPKGGTLRSYAVWEGRKITLKTLADAAVFGEIEF